MKNKNIYKLFLCVSGLILLSTTASFAQTNVFDDVIAASPNHTSLEAALIAANLDDDLQNPAATLTVFAPDDAAFDQLASQLGTTVAGLLALPNLADILTYHVLGSTVPSSAVTNGAIVNPLFTGNTLKLTVTSTGNVFVNQAQVNVPDLVTDNGVVHSLNAVVLPAETVVDVAIDNGFTSLTAAVVAAELLPALSNPFATFTVFAPTNTAFDNLAATLGVTVADLLALPNLADILTYHVLGTEVPSSAVTNGAIVSPLFAGNTLKLTATSTGNVFVNQAQVTLPDVGANNGVVHVINAVVLPAETVVDVAIDNGFTSLTSAVVAAELLPALTNPFSTLTVFAPTNAAFDNLASALGVTFADVLTLANLSDILTYHVLGTEVPSSAVTNGAIVSPLFAGNTLKLTATATGNVFVNQAQVTLPDVSADNGVVHVINAVVLPIETVVDVAIDNGFTSLTAAIVAAELLPVLTDPLAEYTVFAPTNTAFDNLATSLGVTVADLLALPNLADILTYHVVVGNVNSTDLVAGPVATVNGANVIVNLTGGVKINDANVTLADVEADNGVVHVLDKVLMESFLSIGDQTLESVSIYPNPAADVITLEGITKGSFAVVNQLGQNVLSGKIENGNVNVANLDAGIYHINITANNTLYQGRMIKR